jgi:hypothetical protein
MTTSDQMKHRFFLLAILICFCGRSSISIAAPLNQLAKTNIPNCKIELVVQQIVGPLREILEQNFDPSHVISKKARITQSSRK